ncbi:MAG: hypothetical protein Unbinned1966contig1000_33 [Prokaryotic dsDNA virus sp.]|nr:MAG: hypothetical protein Unbinned1966contig1000_33 [Prokaryotic dsDNA virus sp.]|tara:strand:- start:3905 stop:4279 length:375 start_codon:yes stop_codon:yes gene_type:complete
MINMIPIRDDHKKVLVSAKDIKTIFTFEREPRSETLEQRLAAKRNNEQVYCINIKYDSYFEENGIVLSYRNESIRDTVFESIYKTLDSRSNIVDNSSTKAIEPVMRKDPKFTFYDVCVGGALYE